MMKFDTRTSYGLILHSLVMCITIIHKKGVKMTFSLKFSLGCKINKCKKAYKNDSTTESLTISTGSHDTCKPKMTESSLYTRAAPLRNSRRIFELQGFDK